MYTVPFWPPPLALDNIAFQLENASKSGGAALSGKSQIVASGSSRWTAKFDVFVGSRCEVFCYRAIMSALDGQANTILISPCEPGYTPNVIAGGMAMDLAPFGDGSPFSDGSMFEGDGTYAYLAAAANTRDGTITVYCDPAPDAGQYFSIPINGTSRLHLIDSIAAAGPSKTYTLGIRPLLRDAYLVGQTLMFGRPFAEMRLASDMAGELARSKSNNSMCSLQFIEVF